MSENLRNDQSQFEEAMIEGERCLFPINPFVWHRVIESLATKFGHQITTINPDAIRLYSSAAGQMPVLLVEYMGVCPLYGPNGLISITDYGSSPPPEQIVTDSTVGAKFLRFLEVVREIATVGRQIMIETEGKIPDISAIRSGQTGFQVAVAFHFADKGILAKPPLPDATQTKSQLDGHLLIYQAVAGNYLDQEQIPCHFDRYQDEDCYGKTAQREFPLIIERDNDTALPLLRYNAWLSIQAIYPFYVIQRLAQNRQEHKKMFQFYLSALRRRDFEESRDILESVFDLMWNAVPEELRQTVDPLRAFNVLNQIFQLRQRLAGRGGIEIIDRYTDYLSSAFIRDLKQRLTIALALQQPINIEEVFDLTRAFREVIPYPSSSIDDILSTLENSERFDTLAYQMEAKAIYAETATNPNLPINDLCESNRLPKDIKNYLVELIKAFGPNATKHMIRQYLTFDKIQYSGALAVFVERFNALLGLMNKLNQNLNGISRLEINLSRSV